MLNRATVSLILFSTLAIVGCEPEPEPQIIYRPEDVAEPLQLEERRQRQLESAEQIDAFHDFRFEDRLAASGIDFQHKIVDDAGIAYKMVHYDHGNGLSIADVDGDSLLDVYFVNQVGANELWRNLGGARFENVTESAGVGLDSVVSVTSAFADIDNDGDQDLYVTAVREGNFLFENDGTGTFRDISEKAGLRHSGHSSGAVFFDFDGDGLLDLFLTNVGQYTTGERVPIEGLTRLENRESEYFYYVGYGDSTMGKLIPERDEENVLYRNAGDNRFVDVTEAAGVAGTGWSGDAIAWDVNGDGRQDLYVLNMNGNDEYYENVDGRRFELRTPEMFRRTPFGSMGAATLDYNNDGRIDLYLTDMHSDMWETNRYISPVREKERPQRVLPIRLPDGSAPNIFGNALFEQDADGSFTDVALETGTENYWPWGASSGDLNADGFEDLFVTSSMNYPFRYHVNSVLLNEGGEHFADSEFILGVEPRRGGRTAKLWYEVDCGEADHAVCDEMGAEGRVDVWGALGSRTSAIFDLDNDGDLDVVTGEFNDVPMVLVSNLSERMPDMTYVEIDLVGTASNRDGLGAAVRVVTDTLALTKVYNGKSGYLSQSSYPLYFGLGGHDRIDHIEVTWPSGRLQTVRGPLEANQLIEIVEGGAGRAEPDRLTERNPVSPDRP